ncbi:VRR-NUC domain containing protein [uncultured Caudovirales phage]|uniref:VRR-NUC domain containing protein n=1 Tax=uncultured Caudovirales phage TaxID=2100421 RepID=A0A6J5NDM9_9CAUD|nr:VRR-NUC domain containing protein [uncultured Caudovirales phage]CAB4140511.1 VRR-NUC domain containing protein [uncultured Caudovirales phage]CAB4156937.1 VRR-NUC domain containing protein [uncultured Caudovirales phage]
MSDETRIPTEHEEQREFVCWFKQTYKGVRIFAIPNGGLRGRAAAGKLKAEGVSAGVPDLHIPAWSLWVEMKRQKGGVVSAEQKDWINYLSSIGHICIVAKGFEAAKAAIIEFCETHKEQPK